MTDDLKRYSCLMITLKNKKSIASVCDVINSNSFFDNFKTPFLLKTNVRLKRKLGRLFLKMSSLLT